MGTLSRWGAAALVLGTCACLLGAAEANNITFNFYQGYLEAGSDLHHGNYTVEQAKAWCKGNYTCAGFTYFANSSTPAAEPPQTPQYHNVLFKSAIVGKPGTSPVWKAYVRVDESSHLLASYFAPHMVLQAAPLRACLWGNVTDADQDHVQVVLQVQDGSEAPQAHAAPIDANGRWQLCLDPRQASFTAYNLTVTEYPALRSHHIWDVLFGDVWLATGQSNMCFTTRMAFNSSEECSAAAATWPHLRLMSVNLNLADDPQVDLVGGGLGVMQRWAAAAPETVCGPDWGYTSAVAYFFGRDLHRARPATPLGIVTSAYGGIPIEMLSSAEALAQCGKPSEEMVGAAAAVGAPEQQRERALGAGARIAEARRMLLGPALQGPPPDDPADSDTPRGGRMYNAMIAPLHRMSVKGFIFYQGENNVGTYLSDPSYGCRMKALISDWRAKWEAQTGSGRAEMAFLLVQLHAYHFYPYPNFHGAVPACTIGGKGAGDPSDGLPAVRLAQAEALQLPNVGLVSALDLGDIATPYMHTIHPRRKQAVGARLAAEALRVAYGHADLVSSGPRLCRIEPLNVSDSGGPLVDNTANYRLHFNNTGSGLRVHALDAIVFTGLANDTRRTLMRGSIIPTSITATTLDVFFFLIPPDHDYLAAMPGWAAGGHMATSPGSSLGSDPNEKLELTTMAGLWVDYPWVSVYNLEGFPMEPFNVSRSMFNVTLTV